MVQNLLVVSFASQTVTLSTSGKFVNADDLTFVSIHDWDQRKRVSVEVRVGVAVSVVLSKDETLEVTAVLVCEIEASVWPWLDDDFEPFRNF